jgi:hypothetical protein
MAEAKTEAVEVFRQFAWHLAGTLAAPKSRKLPAKPGKR